MIIGTRPAANIEKYQGQYIAVSFVFLGLPIVPHQAIYVVSDKEMYKVPMDRDKALVVYGRFLFMVLAFLLYMFGNQIYGFGSSANLILKGLVNLAALGFFAYGVYAWAVLGQVSDREAKSRALIGAAFKYNMTPEHLPMEMRKVFFSQLLNKARTEHGIDDWRQMILDKGINKRNVNILYALAYYSQAIGGDPEVEEMISTLEDVLKLKKTE